ncbi:helix-turn-helix transcriptional regulator [Pseudomonas sp. GM55]|uniref:helix-turn-helix transcriptional regulator n=1 Tax=Pseudomonas sp. GM55 TaxID=1144333 RepID=UPI000308B5FC|nr:helix-turn-helix transcriptional regulator [Pseudomonas sp. GM55]
MLHCNQVAARRMSQSGFPLYENFTRLHSTNLDTSLQALIRRAAGKDGKRRAGWLRLNPTQQQELLVTPVPAQASFNQHFQKPLVLLAQQLSPEACAERLNVSINTVRSQLRALFRKTDTSRQAELVSLLGRLRS